MPIKDSAHVGGALERLMEHEGATTSQLAWDFNFSKSMVNHIKNDIRKMPADVARESIRLYDNPEYIMDILYEFSDGYTSPVLRGRNIDNHRLALAERLRKEMRVTLHLLDESGLEDTPATLSTERREAVEDLMRQLLSLRVLNDNLLKQLQVEYRFSVKALMVGLVRKWKAVGWI